MSIGADNILLRAAGLLRTVPDANQIEGFKVLDRVADSAALDDWVGHANSGTAVVQIANSSVRSDEFASTHGGLTDTQIVPELYQSFLNRDLDAAGTLVSTGGKNPITGQANIAVFKAAAGATRIPPLSKRVIEISAGRPLETTSAEG